MMKDKIKKLIPKKMLLKVNEIRYRIETGSDFKSGDFWDNWYAEDGTSGEGSYGRLAIFKADFLNKFITEKNIKEVIEFGSGDGHQASLLIVDSYYGYDVSQTAVDRCKMLFKNDSSKKFFTIDKYNKQQAELVLSLDVIYHLVEDEVYEDYMRRLFIAAKHYVIIYSSNDEMIYNCQPHVRHRKFTDWILKNAPDWKLEGVTKNIYPYEEDNPKETSWADFYVFKNVHCNQ